MGFGGQIGFELTDFVFILNDSSAVRTFAQTGSLTLGGNVSLAAGPVGRNAEAAGAASLKGVAGIFSYSKTKGLFAGVSLEGSGIIERRDANEKLYGTRYTAQQLLSGAVAQPPPPGAGPLMNVLNSRVFSGMRQGSTDDVMYNDIPVYDDTHDDVVWNGRRGSAYGEGLRTDRTGSGTFAEDNYGPRSKRSSTWQDDVYDRPSGFGGISRSNTVTTRGTAATRGSGSRWDADDYVYRDNASSFGGVSRSNTAATRGSRFDDEYVYKDNPSGGMQKSAAPGRPTAPKPSFGAGKTLGKNEAVAMFTFEAAQPGDLGFKKGEVITVLKKTESDNDWWYVSL